MTLFVELLNWLSSLNQIKSITSATVPADIQMESKNTNICSFWVNILIKKLCLCLEIHNTQQVRMFWQQWKPRKVMAFGINQLSRNFLLIRSPETMLLPCFFIWRHSRESSERMTDLLLVLLGWLPVIDYVWCLVITWEEGKRPCLK